MSNLRRLDDEFLSGALWVRPNMRIALSLALGIVTGAFIGAVAWPLLALGYSRSDYSVVAVPFMTISLGVVAGLVVSVVVLMRSHHR
ncbi:MAG: hypothetical protein QOC75_4894 [Pseudonocardiales bacterium]|jgi:hypothetical protein|nr:hypothetical protein [Pseudonocardiales bacterium]